MADPATVVVLGAGGFLGSKLVAALLAKGETYGRPIGKIVAADLTAPAFETAAVQGLAVDITDAGAVTALLAEADVIYHLAAVVSGQAEAEFDIGLQVNLMGTLNVLEGARASGRVPRVVYTSSIAVFGGEIPSPVEDHYQLNPQTSYGAQKAAGELLVTDYSRKGFVDGVGLRLPTITIRPGKPNKAASSFMSSIFREPLQGQTANCPADEDFPIWHSSGRTVIKNLVHAGDVKAEDLGQNRCFALPGRTDTVREMIDAMTRVAGPEPATRITWTEEPAITPIIAGWRPVQRINPAKALKLGFTRDDSFEDNVRYFLEDDIQPAGAADPHGSGAA
ncbi:MAG: D-erythronate dehydrogenase [Pseudomonadota bacterium]